MPKLGVVIGSVREGRIGLPIAQWFIERARQHAKFDIQTVDLRAIDLPLFAERHHPRLQTYESEKHKAWSRLVAGLDAFVLVTPEYNNSVSPALLNALDYLYVEWNYKPAAFVSYGGISGGLRAVQMAKPTLTLLKMMPIPEAVTIPFAAQAIDRESGKFKATEQHDRSAVVMLDELFKWSQAMAAMRA